MYVAKANFCVKVEDSRMHKYVNKGEFYSGIYEEQLLKDGLIEPVEPEVPAEEAPESVEPEVAPFAPEDSAEEESDKPKSKKKK